MKKYSQGWIIVGWAALALSAMVAGIIAIYGAGEEGARVTIRATARTSFVLFLTAFTATALVRLWPGGLTKWVRANRRYIGVSFGVSHAFHAIGIAALAFITSGASIRETDISALVGGSLAYLFIAAMVFTSFDRTAAMLGQKKWQILHTTGMYYPVGGLFLQLRRARGRFDLLCAARAVADLGNRAAFRSFDEAQATGRGEGRVRG